MNKFTQGHALLIGVGADLRNTVTDAVGIANVLKDPERCAYPIEQVQVLIEGKATRIDILTALDQLAKTAEPTATVIFYFSGHGYEVNTPIGKQYFLMPYGYDTSDLLNTAISGPEFMAKLEAIKAQKMLILLDCCHAGGIDNHSEKAPGIHFAKAPLPPEAQRLLGKGSGRVIIASSRADQKSYMGEPYSQFTQALLEAFAGEGAAEKDGYVRAADLAMYAARTVSRYTHDQQIPVLNFDKADNFAVAYYAAGDKAPKGLPPTAKRRIAPTTHSEPTTQPQQTTIAAEISGSGRMVVGDQVRGDKVMGDKVGGDQYKIDQITGSQIAIGRNARVQVNRSPAVDLTQTLQPILAAAVTAPLAQRPQAMQKAEAIQQEINKGEQADDERLAALIDDLTALIPDIKQIVKNTFSTSTLADFVGPATRYVLRRIGGR